MEVYDQATEERAPTEGFAGIDPYGTVEANDYALANLWGSFKKLDDALAHRYGVTAEHAVQDATPVIGLYLARVHRVMREAGLTSTEGPL